MDGSGGRLNFALLLLRSYNGEGRDAGTAVRPKDNDDDDGGGGGVDTAYGAYRALEALPCDGRLRSYWTEVKGLLEESLLPR